MTGSARHVGRADERLIAAITPRPACLGRCCGGGGAPPARGGAAGLCPGLAPLIRVAVAGTGSELGPTYELAGNAHLVS